MPKSKLKLFLIILLLVLPIVIGADIDNIKLYDKHQKLVTIKNNLGMGNTLATFQLVNNTDYCGGDIECYAIIKADIRNKRLNPFSKIDFESLNKGRSKANIPFSIKIKKDKEYVNYNSEEEISGVVYFKISGYKNPEEIIDWIPTLYGQEIREWYIWGQLYTYDNFNDNAINYSLWTNGSADFICGGDDRLFYTNETGGYMITHAQICGTCGAFNSALAYATSTNMPTTDKIANVSVRVISSFSSARAGSYTKFYVFGNTIKQEAISDDSIWYIKRNLSAGANKFDIYNDTDFSMQITASDNIIEVRSSCADGSNGQCCNIETNMDYVYYTYGNWSLWVTLNSPINNFHNYYSVPITFNISSNTTLNQLYNISLFIDNVLNETKSVSGTINNTIFQKLISNAGQHNWSVYVCDSDTNCMWGDERNFIVSNVNITSEFYNPTTLEGISETFLANITTSGIVINYVNLVYNGTEYLATLTPIGNDSYQLSRTITTPMVNANMNNTFFWSFKFNDGSTYNSTNRVQSVYDFSIDDCSVNGILLYNFTLRDEASRTILSGAGNNTGIEVDLTLSPYGTTTPLFTYSKDFMSINPARVCSNVDFSNTRYRADLVVTYYADSYAQEFYFIRNGILSNATIPQHIDLHDLLLADSKTFLFKYLDENSQTLEGGIVLLLRKYVGEGIFREVERCQLDNNGECHFHLVEEDVIYKFNVTYEGTFEYLSDEYNAKCLETPCSITLQNIGLEQVDLNYDNLPTGTYSLDTNTATREVSLSFNLDGVGTMGLEVYEYLSGSASDLLIGNETLTASSGTVVVDVPVVYGNRTYYAVVRHNEELVTSQWIDLSESGFQYFGTFGIFLAMLLVLTLGLIAVSHGGWTVMFLVLGLVLSAIVKLIDMDFYMIVWMISAGGIVVYKLATRRGI